MKNIETAESYCAAPTILIPHDIYDINPIPYHAAAGEQRYGMYLFIKRIFDVTASLFGLIFLIPFFIIVAAAIKTESEGPVIFKQTRVGKDGKHFTFYKFRSMYKDAEYRQSELISQNEMDGPVFKIKNDPRVTKVGRILRITSIDELPQLYNILRGEMTFVGPRPPLPSEVEDYTPHQMKRLSVTGGLTCYWQISGRNNIGFDEWVRLDIKYINERSLLVDAKIFMKTFKVVFKRIGAC